MEDTFDCYDGGVKNELKWITFKPNVLQLTKYVQDN